MDSNKMVIEAIADWFGSITGWGQLKIRSFGQFNCNNALPFCRSIHQFDWIRNLGTIRYNSLFKLILKTTTVQKWQTKRTGVRA
jgi:hypothetical protein